MAVNFPEQPALHSIQGARVATVKAGVRYPDRDDLVLIELCPGTVSAVVTTTNAFAAAPVQLLREFAAGTHAHNPRFLVTNTGNANAGTGAQGLRSARAVCEQVAKLGGCEVDQVWAFSTGVIGEQLAADRICAALPAALEGLGADWSRAASGIMTTDTLPKATRRQVRIGGEFVTIIGLCKGSGMIRPNMATMLGYVITDAKLSAAGADEMLKAGVAQSFNRITVDGDTSTNDCCTLSATGQVGDLIEPGSDEFALLQAEVSAALLELAQLIVRDGEGATKFVTVEVSCGKTTDEAAKVAYAVAHSPLVKTALFASDPNWGRLLAAVGYAGVDNLDVSKISVTVSGVELLKDGEPAAGYTEAAGQAVFGEPEIVIQIDLARGDAVDRVYTCDLSYDYVKINADYRS